MARRCLFSDLAPGRASPVRLNPQCRPLFVSATGICPLCFKVFLSTDHDLRGVGALVFVQFTAAGSGLTLLYTRRHIDCAKAYQNQTGLGQALQELYKGGKVSRKDFWLTTKLWNTDHAEVKKNCLESMKELQTDYLDLYLVHWPVTPHVGPTLEPSMEVSHTVTLTLPMQM